MNVKKSAAALLLRVIALMMVASAVPLGAFAQSTGGTGGTSNGSGGTGGSSTSGSTDGLDVNPGYAAFQREMYFQRFPAAREGGPSNMGGHDVITNKQSMGPGSINQGKSGPVFTWPVSIPTATSQVPTFRDQMINDDMFTTYGYPVSDTQFQVIQRYNHNRLLEQAFDPEKIMWASTATAGMQATSAANGAASASVNQAQSAIDFTKKYLTNFTAEAGNRWQKIRDQLFIPMAILLLLPGAVLAQVKAIVSQGSTVLGDTNPFEGILRSIIAIFLIPATFLVINYGIDVSNSITFTIADEYKRIFGSDMYEDAQCAQKRAFPVNPADRNDNAMIKGENPPDTTGTTAWDPYEALTLNLRQYDPCAHIDKTRTPDERVRDAKKITRLMMNGANVGLTGTWNVMCAFQMAFLYYLWCMGPIAAALWVWPMQRLRGALPSWIEGVVTLCFWSLFWNTTVLLMACFRGVGDSGTVLMSALNFLANVCVKYAFDFSSLVSQGGSSGVSNAVQQAMGQAGGAAGGGHKGGNAAAAGAHPGAPGAHPGGSTTNTTGSVGTHPGGAAGLNSALRNATNQNLQSGVFGGASSIPGLTGDHNMPLGSTLAAHGGGLTGPGSQNAIGVGRDAGLPPGVMPGGPGGAGGMGGSGIPGMPGGEGAFNFASANGGMFPFSSTSTGGFTGGAGGTDLAHQLSAGANSLGLHMNNGHLQVNPNALHNMEANLSRQMNDPNSAAHRELAAAMNGLQNGDPRALQAFAQQAANGIGGLDPQTSRALGALAMDAQTAYQSGGLNASDMNALSAFSSGQLGPNGQPALGFGPDGTLMNNMTGAPVDFSNVNNSLNLNGLPQTGITYDPATGAATNSTFSQMIADGSIQSLPTNGIDGMARTLGCGADQTSFVNANGQPLPPNAVDAQGHFAQGFAPQGDVYAVNNSTGGAMARYDGESHTWQALNAQGSPNGVVMGANGDWVAPSSGGAVPVTYDNGTHQWYASNSGGNVIYDQSSGQMSTPQGVALNYDGHTYTAQNDNQIRYDQNSNSFMSTTTGAYVQSGSDGQWYASGTNGAVTLNTSDNNLYMAGSSGASGAQVQYSSSSDTYSSAGGQVYYDNSRGSFEVAQSGAPVSYSNGTWYASDTNNQIAYNTSSHQMEAAGSNAAMVYNQNSGGYSTADGQISYNNSTGSFQAPNGQSVTATGDQWYASNSNYTVAYDQQNQRFEAAGTTQPLSYGPTSGGGYGWSASGTNGNIQYDTSTGSYSSYGNAAVYYSPQGGADGGGTYYAAGTNGGVYYDNSSQNWVGGGSSGGGAVAYSYDNSSSSWVPSGGLGGSTYQIDSSQQYAQSQQAYSNVAQHEYSAQQTYASYAQQQQVDQQQQQVQMNQQFATEQRQLQEQYASQQQQQYTAQQQQQYAQQYADQQQQQYAAQQQQQYNQQQIAQQSTDYPGQNPGGPSYGTIQYDNSGTGGSGGTIAYDSTSGGGTVQYDSPTIQGGNDYYSYDGGAQQISYETGGSTHTGGLHHHNAGYSEGYQGNPDVPTSYTGSSGGGGYSAPGGPNPRPQPQPPGGLMSVPFFARGKGPTNQPAPPEKQPHPPGETGPEAPTYKKGPMEMGAKQGGYKTQKDKDEQEALRQQWIAWRKSQGLPYDDDIEMT
ncbi:MAG TPA: hypothetical protein V6C76_15760 [Drouetiella sp.]